MGSDARLPLVKWRAKLPHIAAQLVSGAAQLDRSTTAQDSRPTFSSDGLSRLAVRLLQSGRSQCQQWGVGLRTMGCSSPFLRLLRGLDLANPLPGCWPPVDEAGAGCALVPGQGRLARIPQQSRHRVSLVPATPATCAPTIVSLQTITCP